MAKTEWACCFPMTPISFWSRMNINWRFFNVHPDVGSWLCHLSGFSRTSEAWISWWCCRCQSLDQGQAEIYFQERLTDARMQRCRVCLLYKILLFLLGDFQRRSVWQFIISKNFFSRQQRRERQTTFLLGPIRLSFVSRLLTSKSRKRKRVSQRERLLL